MSNPESKIITDVEREYVELKAQITVLQSAKVLDIKKLEKLRNGYKTFCKKNPSHGMAIFELAKIHTMFLDYIDSITILENFLELEEANDDTHFVFNLEIANIYKTMKIKDDELYHLEQCLAYEKKVDNNNVMSSLYFRIAEFYLHDEEKQDLDMVQNLYMKCINLSTDPQNVIGLVNKMKIIAYRINKYKNLN